MKKIIVIGANGFLGCNLAARLAQMNYEIIALVAFNSEYSALKKYSNITCLEFDFSTLEKISTSNFQMIKGVDTIFHMAWAGVSTTHKNEAFVQAQNIQYGLSVMAFALRNDIRRIIVPGSAAEYACSNTIINGKSYPAPSDLYSAAKIATRILCQTYASQNNIEFIWTAITSIYGPGRNDNNLITYAIKMMLKREKPSFTGLEQQWDYLYIDDLINALIAIGERGKNGKIYPIGSGEHRQMLEYIKLIHKKIAPDLPLGIGDIPYKNKTIDNQILDISELEKDTGFQPKFTFEQGIERTIEYFKS